MNSFEFAHLQKSEARLFRRFMEARDTVRSIGWSLLLSLMVNIVTMFGLAMMVMGEVDAGFAHKAFIASCFATFGLVALTRLIYLLFRGR